MKNKEFKIRTLTSCILLFLVFLIIFFDFALLYSLIILGILSLIEFFNLTKKIFKANYLRILLNIVFSFYIILFCFLFFFLTITFNLKLILFSLLFGCIASDIGGYIFGKTFRGPKLTKISPNKTISGSLGSIILTIFILVILNNYLTKNFDFKIVILAIITSITCQAGDLLFSFMKRKAKVKDTGNFLPGHGGALDRLDSILLGLPFGYLTLIILY